MDLDAFAVALGFSDDKDSTAKEQLLTLSWDEIVLEANKKSVDVSLALKGKFNVAKAKRKVLETNDDHDNDNKEGRSPIFGELPIYSLTNVMLEPPIGKRMRLLPEPDWNLSVAQVIQATKTANDLQRQNKELGGLLRSPVPMVYNDVTGTFEPQYLLWNEVVGNAHERLKGVIKASSFRQDGQQRKFVAIVQAYGCGKTRTALVMSHFFLTLIWRVDRQNGLLKAVVDAQDKLRGALPPDPSFATVKAFSESCIRLLRIALLAHLELFHHLASSGAIDANSPNDRMMFTCLQLVNPTFGEWMLHWFRTNKGLSTEGCASAQARILAAYPTLQLVYVIDEPQSTYGLCLGYALHYRPTSNTESEQMQKWHAEQSNGGNHPTNLFYQLRMIILESLMIQRPDVAFVMCSTEFRTWRALETDDSPLSRDLIERFYDVHWFTDDDVRGVLSRQFNLCDEVLNHEEVAAPFPSYFHRPYFLIELIELMLVRLKGMPTDQAGQVQWFSECIKERVIKSKSFASGKLTQLMDANYSADLYTTKGIVFLLLIMLYLSGGLFNANASSKAGNTFLQQVVTQGVVRLVKADNQLRIADVVHEDSLRALFVDYKDRSANDDPVLRVFADKTVEHAMIVRQDKSSKGFTTERVLAWLLLKGVVVDMKTDATRAGTVEELALLGVADDVELFCHVRAQGDVIAFPGTLAGPDLFWRGSWNSETSFFALQCKVENKVYSFKDLTEALVTISPSTMFRRTTARADEGAGEASSSTAEKKKVVAGGGASEVTHNKWRLQQGSFRKIVRVVFCALGFTKDAQFLVREYNLLYPDRPIMLQSLATLGDAMGPFKDSLLQQLTVPVADRLSNSTPTHAAGWVNLAPSTRTKLTNDKLSTHCLLRGLPYSGNKATLQGRLQGFDLLAVVKPLYDMY